MQRITRPCVHALPTSGKDAIDNNDVERSQRPSVMGRKNFLFSKTD